MDREESFGFGCASLFRLATSKQRHRLLNAAYDEGIRYFDVARMYGLGQAEAELARCLGDRRHSVQLATKFGYPLSEVRCWRALAHQLGRPLVRIFPHLRRFVGNQAKRLYAAKDFSLAAAQLSLETSLRELSCDRVEYFFLHEPTIADEITPELFQWLVRQKERGTIKNFGVSGDLRDSILPQNVAQFKWPVLQFSEVFALPVKESASSAVLDRQIVTFGAISAGLPRLRAALARDTTLEKKFSSRFECLPLDENVLPAILLRRQLYRYPQSRVIFSTTRVERIGSLLQLVESLRWDDDHERFLVPYLSSGDSP